MINRHFVRNFWIVYKDQKFAVFNNIADWCIDVALILSGNFCIVWKWLIDLKQAVHFQEFDERQ